MVSRLGHCLLPLLGLQLGPSSAVLSDAVQKGIAFGAGQWSAPAARFDTALSDQSLEQLARTGASHVRLLVAEYQDSVDATRIYAIEGPSPLRSSTEEEVAHAIRKASLLGLKVFLSPVVDLNWDIASSNQPTKVSRSQIGQSFSAVQWDAWFASYEAFILRYAKMAADSSLHLLSVGSGLECAFGQEKAWRSLIAKVRAAFPKLQLTISANGTKASEVKFWDELDFLGVTGFFSLSEGGAQSSMVSELVKAWTSPVASLAALSAQWEKPVLLTEVGYQSRPHCWETPARTPRRGQGSDCSAWPGCFELECQADAYEAALQVFSKQEWFAGLYLWLWRSDSSAGGTSDSDFTPKGKPAEDVLKKWFSGSHIVSPAIEPAATVARPLTKHSRAQGKLVRNGYVFGLSEWTGRQLAADSPEVLRSVDEAVRAGVNSLEFPAMWYIVNRTDTTMFPIFDRDSNIRSSSDEELTNLMRYASSRGLRIALSPMIDGTCQGFAYPDAQCYWRAESGTGFNDTQWDAWFESYRVFILHYAKLAGDLGTDVVQEFHVSHELNTPEMNAPLHHWEQLLKDVRAVFKGQVATALNWGPYVQGDPKDPIVPAWVKSLDYVGIDCYFPVKVSVSQLPWQMPVLEDLLDAWKPIVEAMKAYSVAAGNKKLVCTEVGYQSRPFSFLSPAGNVMLNEADCSVWDQCVSVESQALAYEAIFQSLYPNDWFEGFYLWLWRGDPTAGGTSDDDFTPQRKPATLAVLDKWWKQPAEDVAVMV